ncbi:hypothetical protein F5Y00DRAFT_242417 [Daldinia vernicosa]|uniref:uncharacterized protein n=1 Tax=Daldinia vernicosa TaxID=114800 RepID=UPI0020075859|nr:uncharacterized protein F5Y00DRAFT_242417 [Daldinia vernicosa]KAI0847145.1 hypothetical protein F5Y00DRAFT_242417 [Daldinia vernicosa]
MVVNSLDVALLFSNPMLLGAVAFTCSWEDAVHFRGSRQSDPISLTIIENNAVAQARPSRPVAVDMIGFNAYGRFKTPACATS